MGFCSQLCAGQPVARTRARLCVFLTLLGAPFILQAAGQVTLSPGVRLAIRLDNTISTKNHYFGPIIQATLDQNVLAANDTVAIPAGSTIKLAISEFKRAGRITGRARLRLRLYSVVMPDGTEVPLDGYATRLDNNRKPGREGTFKGHHGLVKDAAFDLTSVAAGAGAGLAVGGPLGLPVGAGAGLLAAGIFTVARRGPDLVLPAGTVIEFTLARPATVYAPLNYGPDPAFPSERSSWGQGLVIPPSPDLVGLLDQLNDPKAVIEKLNKVNFRNRPDSDRVFALYLRGVCNLKLSNPKRALAELEEAYVGAKKLNMPGSAQQDIARSLVMALQASSKHWQSSPLMEDPELQAVLVQPGEGE